MGNDHAPRMRNEEYFDCLERAASARSPAEVQGIRQEVSRRWRGDPRADDLTEALYSHQLRLEERASESRARARSHVGERGRMQSERTGRGTAPR